MRKEAKYPKTPDDRMIRFNTSTESAAFGSVLNKILYSPSIKNAANAKMDAKPKSIKGPLMNVKIIS